jgi:hypothetical protein
VHAQPTDSLNHGKHEGVHLPSPCVFWPTDASATAHAAVYCAQLLSSQADHAMTCYCLQVCKFTYNVSDVCGTCGCGGSGGTPSPAPPLEPSLSPSSGDKETKPK